MCISSNTFCQQIVIVTERWLFLWSFLFCVSGQLHFNLLRVTLITQWIIARRTYYSVNHCASHLLLSESLRVALITQWIIARLTYYSVNQPPRHSWNIVESGVKYHKPNQINQEPCHNFTTTGYPSPRTESTNYVGQIKYMYITLPHDRA